MGGGGGIHRANDSLENYTLSICLQSDITDCTIEAL